MCASYNGHLDVVSTLLYHHGVEVNILPSADKIGKHIQYNDVHGMRRYGLVASCEQRISQANMCMRAWLMHECVVSCVGAASIGHDHQFLPVHSVVARENKIVSRDAFSSCSLLAGGILIACSWTIRYRTPCFLVVVFCVVEVAPAFEALLSPCRNMYYVFITAMMAMVAIMAMMTMFSIPNVVRYRSSLEVDYSLVVCSMHRASHTLIVNKDTTPWILLTKGT